MGEHPPGVRDLPARGGLTCDATDQLGLLLFLHDDPDPAVSTPATHTLDAVSRAVREAFLARPEATLELRELLGLMEPRETLVHRESKV